MFGLSFLRLSPNLPSSALIIDLQPAFTKTTFSLSHVKICRICTPYKQTNLKRDPSVFHLSKISNFFNKSHSSDLNETKETRCSIGYLNLQKKKPLISKTIKTCKKDNVR